ncbi:NAD(P)/FAD-dependent oxidoreductase [Flavimaricola marinus]|uniref:HI0933-like protein n=1 Tax=Flavimaricola marinus TaxID=1819565 RepID=A0A238LDU2_9RHOB|nr:NAD(P)/FAD-dependent oxidoreductase [Flavimaricola marinus]SMY07713.1 HI0933-like protein [Flavimaricola marinus]
MHVKTLILGAGAAGLFCAAHAGPGTLIIDHAKAPGEKIRISGGGRCNFTNLGTSAANFLSENPHFCKSALKRYTQWDFISLVDRYGIDWHEKTLGQLFCDGKATQIVDMLTTEVKNAGAELWLDTTVKHVGHDGAQFTALLTRKGASHQLTADNLVLATGGKSIPKMGATGLAYDIAERFGLRVTETRPALVPFTFPAERFQSLAGIATPARVSTGAAAFDEALLFTHRGLSGPAVLQASSYWQEGHDVTLTLCPTENPFDWLRTRRATSGKRNLTTVLTELLPGRLIDYLAHMHGWKGNLADQSDARLTEIADALQNWVVRPAGTEGYRTAEVTLGGIATEGLSSRSMEATALPGLYAIGEAVDVTGWLGGYNFQWAWSSGWAAGTAIASKS